MKKIIICFLFLIVVLFIFSCDITKKLVDSKWEVRNSTTIEDVILETVIFFEFSTVDNFEMTTLISVGGKVTTDSISGKWSVDDDLLTMEVDGKKELYLVKIKGDTLNLVFNDENKTPFLSLTRVK